MKIIPSRSRHFCGGCTSPATNANLLIPMGACGHYLCEPCVTEFDRTHRLDEECPLCAEEQDIKRRMTR
jgi:hypothetical protein